MLKTRCEDDICVKYYFKNVHIDLTHHYEMVDNYGLSAILQYVRLSELDDFDELFYYDGKLGPLYQKEKTTFKDHGRLLFLGSHG